MVRTPGGVPGRSAPMLLGQALTTWVVGWLLGSLAGSAVVGAAGYGSHPSDAPAWVYVLSALVSWAAILAAVWVATYRVGSRSVPTETRLRFRPIDLVGLPIGVFCQVALIQLVYWPLRAGWPSTFARDAVEKNANDLYHRAGGLGLALIVVTAALGAPLVEELVYRGLLQGAAERAAGAARSGVAVVGVAVLFALIHLRPVEYPGLLVFALVVGTCAWRTGRIGMSIATHVAFNATGLVMVAMVR